MSADKHPADVLAEQNETINDEYPASARVLMRAESARMLRRIPELEYERDQQRRTITALMAGMPEDGTTPVIARIGRLEAERDHLRAEVQRWSVLAASFEAERNLLREEISDLHKANAARKQQ